MSWDLTIGVNQPKEPGGLCLLCGLQIKKVMHKQVIFFQKK